MFFDWLIAVVSNLIMNRGEQGHFHQSLERRGVLSYLLVSFELPHSQS